MCEILRWKENFYAKPNRVFGISRPAWAVHSWRFFFLASSNAGQTVTEAAPTPQDQFAAKPCRPPAPDDGCRIGLALATMRHGKTNLMKWVLRETPYRRTVVIDPKKEYDAYGRIVKPADLPAALAAAGDGRFHFVIRGRLDEAEADFIWSTLSGENNDGNGACDTLIVVDESHRWMSAQSCPETLQEMLRYQGHNCQQIWFATQLAADLWRGLRGFATEVCSWRYYEPRDKAVAAGWLGIDPAAMDALGAHEYFRWRARDGAAPTITKELAPLVVDK